MGQETTEAAGRTGISGYTLKWIAIVTMFIDHFAAVVIERMLDGWLTVPGNGALANYELWRQVYMLMRCIGRMAFPIFCFLLVEGFLHTRSVWKYALRLGIFAVITEVPFDMAFQKSYWDFSYNNVMITLLIGLLTLCGISAVYKWLMPETAGMTKRLLGWMLITGLTGAGMLAAELLHTDYGGAGVIAIVIMYLFYHHRLAAFGVAVAALAWLAGTIELLALLMLVPLCFYNGTRGRGMKYFFYVFYPAHLLLLALLCIPWGLG